MIVEIVNELCYGVVCWWCSVVAALGSVLCVLSVLRVVGVGVGVVGVCVFVYDSWQLVELIVCAHRRPKQSTQSMWMWIQLP